MGNPTTSIGWVIFLACKYSDMFIEGTLLTLYIAILGTILGFIVGYAIGLIQDSRINPQDSLLKKIIMRIVKNYFDSLRGNLSRHSDDCSGDGSLLRT